MSEWSQTITSCSCHPSKHWKRVTRIFVPYAIKPNTNASQITQSFDRGLHSTHDTDRCSVATSDGCVFTIRLLPVFRICGPRFDWVVYSPTSPGGGCLYRICGQHNVIKAVCVYEYCFALSVTFRQCFVICNSSSIDPIQSVPGGKIKILGGNSIEPM